MAVSYDKNTDYQALINKSVGAGDFGSAAQYEKQRNAKIVGEGLNTATTNNYTGYLPSTDYINTMYDNQKKSTLAGLEEAYNKNVAAVGQTYDAQKREVTGNADVQRKNMNELFAANGLNTGAVGQANLALGNQRTANLGNLSAAQAAKTADLKTTYQSEVQKAIAESDFDRANALYGEYQNEQERRRQAAEKEKATAQNQVDALLKMGVKPSDALVAASGYSPDYVNQYYNAYLAQLQSTASGGSGGGGGRRSGGGSGNGGTVDTTSEVTAPATVASTRRSTNRDSRTAADGMTIQQVVNNMNGMTADKKSEYIKTLLNNNKITSSQATAAWNYTR